MNRKIIAMIPARVGSERLKLKNLALINDKPLIFYAIQAARNSGLFDEIVLNSDSNIFEKISKRYNINFYLRPKNLGSSDTKSDDVVADFMKQYNPEDIVVWVNTVNPFHSAQNITEVITYFIKNNLDSLITVEEKQVHTNFQNKPLNYKIEEPFDKTQDLEKVQPFVYSLMMWRVSTFISHYKKNGFALFSGKFGVYKVDGLLTIKIKTEKDLLLADKIMRSMESNRELNILKYDKLVEK